MNKKVNIIIAAVVFFFTVTASFFVADYFELLGTTIEKRLSFTEIRFRTLDKETGGVIMNAGVRCFQKNTNNACTLKNSHQVGVISVNVPIQKAVKKTLLFKKAEEIYKSIDPDINIMIIHNNYYKQTVTLAMEKLYANSIIEKTIEMEAVEPDERQSE